MFGEARPRYSPSVSPIEVRIDLFDRTAVGSAQVMSVASVVFIWMAGSRNHEQFMSNSLTGIGRVG